MRSYWIRVGPKFNVGCPHMKRRGHTEIYTKEGRPCEDGGREWSYVAMSQGTSGATGSRKRQSRILS